MRSIFEYVVSDRAGNVIQNAKVLLRKYGTSDPASGAWDAPTGGQAVTELTSDGDGYVRCWWDAPKLVDLIITDNGDAAFYPWRTTPTLTFPDAGPITRPAGNAHVLLERFTPLEYDSGWILPGLASDVTVGATWAHHGYRRVGKIVWIAVNLAITSVAADKLLFTLPAGFRPSPDQADGGGRLALAIGASGGYIRIHPTNGEVRTNSTASSIIGSNSFPTDDPIPV